MKQMKKVLKLFFVSILSLLIFSISYSEENYREEMVKLVNTEREKSNLPPLILDEKLNKIAEDKVALLIKEGKLNHLAGGYKSFGEFLQKYDISYSLAGENIAKKTKTSMESHKLWMSSNGHRANILNKGFTNIGIAKNVDKNGDIYWVEIFINPEK